MSDSRVVFFVEALYIFFDFDVLSVQFSFQSGFVNELFFEFSDILLLNFSLVSKFLQLSVGSLYLCFFLFDSLSQSDLLFTVFVGLRNSVVPLFGQVVQLSLYFCLSALIFFELFLDFSNVLL